jgi:RNA polymerase sigma-70 factor (ECF subfamily)
VDESADTSELLAIAAVGDPAAMNQLFARHQDRLRRMVRLRLNRRLQGRIDENDVVQEAFLEAAKKLSEYLARPEAPFFLWLRTLTGLKLAELHRHHLGTQMRDADRDVSLYAGALPEANSLSLAAQLLGTLTSPSKAAIRAERQIRLQEVLNSLDPIDREILALRHFEQLTSAEAAQVLGMSPSGATARHMRALKRLRTILESTPGFFDP